MTSTQCAVCEHIKFISADVPPQKDSGITTWAELLLLPPARLCYVAGEACAMSLVTPSLSSWRNCVVGPFTNY
jgi:hypothetical protein